MEPMELSHSSLARVRRRQFSDYNIVFFCPLVVEQQAACLMLDEIHDDEPPRNIGQTIAYTFGRIASYNVAIAAYPGGEAGIGISGSMVTEAQRDFGKHLEFGVLLGIGAGTPSSKRDIRLGDVAVAYPNKDNGGIVGYDMKKVEETGEVIKQWQHATDPTLRSAMNKIQVHEDRAGHDFRRHLEVLRDHPKFRRPLSRALSSEFAESPTRRSLNNTSPEVHYGTILSGNAVIKMKAVRDDLRDKWDSIAIEMEAAGITSRLGVAVVRGISDFADSNKNDDWHGYAAIVAAAYAKELVIKLGSVQRKQGDISPESVISIDLDVCLSLALPPPSQNFVGREAELRSLFDFVASQPQKISQASTLAVYGLGGVGKTQLIAELVGRLRQQNDSCDIFWLTGETKEAFEQSVASTLKGSQGSADSGPQENYSEHRTIHIDSFFAELRGTRRRRWLLVVDGVPGDQEIQSYIIRRLEKLINGSVILTTRNRSLMQHTSQGVEIKGLSESDAVEFLQKANADSFPDDEKGTSHCPNFCFSGSLT